MTYNNALFSGFLGKHFKLDMMVPKRSKEAPKTSELLTVLLPVAIPETQNNTEDRGSMYKIVELKRKLIHQLQIPDRQ